MFQVTQTLISSPRPLSFCQPAVSVDQPGLAFPDPAHRFSTWFQGAIILLCGLCLTLTVPASAQEPEQEKAAWSIADVASKAQNANDYSFAAQQWEKLLSQYPDSKLAGKAHYNLGICHDKNGQYELAVEQFGKAIPKLTGLEADLQPLAYFYQAYCQFQIGKKSIEAADQESQRQANIQLTTATDRFAELLSKFPQFAAADQALFFQGNAFELLKRYDDAIKSYTKMLDYPQANFFLDGVYIIGQIKQEQGKFVEAIEYYDRFRKELKTETHPLLSEVDFSKGKALLSLAAERVTEGDAKGAVERYRAAEAIFSQLAKLTNADQKDLAHEALFQQACCLANLDQPEKAAQLYEQVAARQDSPLLVQSLVNAGRCYLTAKQNAQAIAVFKRATEHDSDYALEGASLLTKLYLEQDNPTAAFELADQWLKQQPDSKLAPYLMYDRADAALKLPNRVADAPAMFLALVDKYPEHSTAPAALYGAAYALFQQTKSADAIAAVERFETSFPTSELLPDCREIKADAMLLTDEAAAETVYDQLIQEFPEHEKLNRWYLRSAVAKFLQQKYQPTVDRLKPRLTQFTDLRQAAEAYHWVGASQFFLDQVPDSIANLEKSLASGEPWRSTDETLLTLARAYLKNKQVTQAVEQVQRLKQQLPDSSLIERGYYYLGEYAYDSADYESAFENFETVYTKFPKSELVPSALYNAAWSKMKLNQADASNQLFSRLIQDFPQHDLAAQAQAGRGAAARKSGNMADSIKDLKAFVETKADGTEKWGAMFELAMAQVESKAWDDAAATLTRLIKEDATSEKLDAYHYELAWVLHELQQVPKSLEHFAAITKLTPVSKHAGEAYFHLGSEEYRTENWKAAEDAFQKAVELSSADVIGEKALYKLGWTFYKQNQFASAYTAFDKQVQQFPSTSFAADGFFMRAESLYQQKKYDEALKAYQAAQPIVEASDTIDPKLVSLTYLHGAQAANQVKAFQAAVDLATPLTTGEGVSPTYQADAWLELGSAFHGLSKAEEAKQAWEKAKLGADKTAVRASCLIGDHYFKAKQFDDAISQFKEIQYRYSDAAAAPEVKSWVAYAYYEAARCYLVQITTATEEQKPDLVKEAIKQFETLLEKYPQDPLATEAKSQVEKLRQLRR